MQEGRLLSAHKESERASQRVYQNWPLEDEERESHLRWRKSMCKGQGAIQEEHAQSTAAGLVADPEPCEEQQKTELGRQVWALSAFGPASSGKPRYFSAETRGSLLQEDGQVGQVGGSWMAGGKNGTLARSLKLRCWRGEMNFRSGRREARDVDGRQISPGNRCSTAGKGEEGRLREDSAFGSS